MPIYPLFAAPINIGLRLTFFCYCHMTCMSWGLLEISSPIGTGGCRNQWQKWAEQLGNGLVTSRIRLTVRKIDDSDCNKNVLQGSHSPWFKIFFSISFKMEFWEKIKEHFLFLGWSEEMGGIYIPYSFSNIWEYSNFWDTHHSRPFQKRSSFKSIYFPFITFHFSTG